MVFNTPSGLSRHRYTHAEKGKRCTDCGKSFHFESELAQHRITHRKVPGFKCNYGNCERHFMNNLDLLKHIRTHKASPIIVSIVNIPPKTNVYCLITSRCTVMTCLLNVTSANQDSVIETSLDDTGVIQKSVTVVLNHRNSNIKGRNCTWSTVKFSLSKVRFVPCLLLQLLT